VHIKINIERAYKYFDKATLFFLCALIFFIPISNAAIQICVSLTILSFIGATITKKLKNIPKTALDIPLLAFFIFLCFSVIFSINPHKSLISLILKNFEWFLLFFIVVATLNTKKRINVFLKVLFFSALCVAIDGLTQQIFGHDLFRGQAFQERISASFRHYNDFAAYLGVMFPITISLYVCNENKLRPYFIFLSVLLGYCLVMTLSRGGYFTTFIGINFIVFFSLIKLKSLNYKKLAINLLIFINLLVLTMVIGIYNLRLDLIIERLRISGGAGRNGIWEYATLLIKARPFFGYGMGSFMGLFSQLNKSISPTYAHNCYLQMLVESGLFGLLSFLAIVFVFFKTTLKTVIKNNDFLLLGVSSGILVFLIHAGFDTHFYSMQLSDFFWIILGLAIAMVKNGPVEI